MAIHQKGLIVCDPKILNGKPIIKGTRISVALILQNIASGMTREEIIRGYPTLTEEGFDAALDFAARQFQGEENFEMMQAAESSIKFWENSTDDAIWNRAL